MVRAGRVACIFTPYLLTLGALICIIIVFLGGSANRNAFLDDLYFAKLDLTNFTTAASANLAGSSGDLSVLTGALQAAKQQLGMKDYYTIYLRGYCGWNGNDQYANCSSSSTYFWFNPISIWGLNSNTTGQAIEQVLPESLRTGLNTYEKVSKAMDTAYLVALIVTVLTLVVGISAIFSRWGSFATTFFATASWIFLVAGSSIAIGLYASVKTILNEDLQKDYGITTQLGDKGYVVIWIGCAFALGSGFFWFFSVCCCSGREHNYWNPGSKDARRTRAEKTPYSYERVGSPYLGPQGDQAVPLTNVGHSGYNYGPQSQRQTAYKPFRQA